MLVLVPHKEQTAFMVLSQETHYYGCTVRKSHSLPKNRFLNRGHTVVLCPILFVVAAVVLESLSLPGFVGLETHFGGALLVVGFLRPPRRRRRPGPRRQFGARRVSCHESALPPLRLCHPSGMYLHCAVCFCTFAGTKHCTMLCTYVCHEKAPN